MLHIRENTRIQKPDANATHGYVLRTPKAKEERGECEMFRLALGNTFNRILEGDCA